MIAEYPDFITQGIEGVLLERGLIRGIHGITGGGPISIALPISCCPKAILRPKENAEPVACIREGRMMGIMGAADKIEAGVFYQFDVAPRAVIGDRIPPAGVILVNIGAMEMRTHSVSRLTTLYLLRLRFLIEQPDHAPLLAEEVQVIGHYGTADKPTWISGDEALKLLGQAKADANIGDEEKRDLISTALNGWNSLDSAVEAHIAGRAEVLTEAHRRIRQAVSMRVRGLTVKPQMPPDLLGLLVLQPFVGNP